MKFPEVVIEVEYEGVEAAGEVTVIFDLRVNAALRRSSLALIMLLSRCSVTATPGAGG
jgi:hypothetical protein